MKRNQPNSSLAALFARVDKVRMSAADRQNAKAALTQADALAGDLLAAIDFVKRLLGAGGLHPTSAHS